MVRPLPVYRGNRMFIVQMLLAAFPEKDREVVVGFDGGLDALSVDQEQRQKLVFLDGFVQELLLDIGPSLRTVFGRVSCPDAGSERCR